jgi:hypothetical protein
MRIYHVKKSRKDQGQCGKCRDPLPAGSAYRWIKARYGPKKRRCMKATCRFRPSDMTSSDNLADIYLAQEDAQDELARVRGELDETDVELVNNLMTDLAGTLEESAQSARDVGERYEDGAQAQEEYFYGSYQIDEIREKSEAAEQYADELDEAHGTAQELADSTTEGGEWAMEDIESGLEDIETKIESLEMP